MGRTILLFASLPIREHWWLERFRLIELYKSYQLSAGQCRDSLTPELTADTFFILFGNNELKPLT